MNFGFPSSEGGHHRPCFETEISRHEESCHVAGCKFDGVVWTSGRGSLNSCGVGWLLKWSR